ncbi:MAG: GNAT family N-acetyltransferase [Christensenellaceae bacterium]
MAIEYFHIKERDFDLVEQLIEMERSSYDSGALDVFDLIAMLRHARVYVAVEYDEILGSVYFMRNFDNPDKVFLHSINIVNADTHPNLGTSLLNIAFADMKAFGIKLAEVNVDPSNYRALKIYREQLGFVASDSMQSDILDGQEILMLQKEL